MDDQREHPNLQGLEELMSLGLGPGRLIEAGDILKMQIEKATGFRVATNTNLNNGTQLYVNIQTHDRETVARFNLELFPGNHDIIVSTGAFVAENRRGVGIGWQMLKMRMFAAKKVGFIMMLATVEEKNAKQRELLSKNGWLYYETMRTPTALFYFKKL